MRSDSVLESPAAEGPDRAPAQPAASPRGLAKASGPWKAAVWALILAAGAAGFVRLTNARYLYSSYYKNLDEFQHISALAEVAQRGYPAISMTPSVLKAIPWFYDFPADAVPIDRLVVAEPYFNDLYFHTSFIQYLQAPLAWIFGAAEACAATTVGIVFAMALIPLWYLRKRSVPWPLALLFAAVAITHQHALGILLGEYNPARLVIPLSLCAFLAMEGESSASPYRTFAWAFLAALCREEAGFYCALAIGAYLTLTRRWTWKWSAVVAALGVFSVGMIWLTRLDASIPLATKGTMSQLTDLPTVMGNLMRPDRPYFLAVNLIGFACLAFFDWRKCLVALLLMFPNMITTVGGAEATGFGTYYHSFYVGALLWASMSGLAELWSGIRTPLKAVLACLALSLPLIYGLAGNSVIRHPVWWTPAAMMRDYVNVLRSARPILAYIRAMRGEILPEDRVVTGAPVIALAGHARHVFFAPINLSRADVVILWDLPTGPGVDPNGWLEPEKMSLRILDHMRRDGFDVDHPKAIDRFLVYRRA